MGRHSAPGDEDVDEPVGDPADAGLTLLTGDVDEAPGRHARDDAAPAVDAVTATGAIDAPDVPIAELAEPAAPTDRIVPLEAPPDEAPPKRQSNTQADLRMLRENPGVRWQILGAVLGSFVAYTIVMLAIGRIGDYAYWVWIPIVLSGVLIGAVLDWAHRRAASNHA